MSSPGLGSRLARTEGGEPGLVTARCSPFRGAFCGPETGTSKEKATVAGGCLYVAVPVCGVSETRSVLVTWYLCGKRVPIQDAHRNFRQAPAGTHQRGLRARGIDLSTEDQPPSSLGGVLSY